MCGILNCADITLCSVCEFAMPSMEVCWSYTMPMEQTDLFHSSTHRAIQQGAFVRLCDSTRTNTISVLHVYVYVLRWNGSNTYVIVGTAVAQWLRCCATNRKVAGSIPDGVIGIFH